MLFGVTSIVRWVIGPSLISRAIPEIQVELLIVGASVAILIAGSNPQSARQSDRGSHEPRHLSGDVAIRRFPRSGCRALYRCSVARISFRRVGCSRRLGSGGGRTAGSLRSATTRTGVVCDSTVRSGNVKYGSHRSSRRGLSGSAQARAIRALDRRRSNRPAIAMLGTSTGGSVNPARQFGPAALSGQTRFLWVYLLAPMAGAMLATWIRETVQRHRSVLTHRLCGTHRDGSSLSG